MKNLLLLALLVAAPAVAEVPFCYPGEDAASSMLPIIVADDKENCAAVFFCDLGNHKWTRYAIVGHGDNMDNCAYGYAKAVAALFMTKAQKDALWTERFVTGAETDPGKLAQYQAQDAPAWALAEAVPYPDTIPPSGLVTQDTKVYAVSSSTDFNVLSPVGTIALGVQCDVTQSVINSTGRYFVVPSSKVTWTGTKRLRVYAACDAKIP